MALYVMPWALNKIICHHSEWRWPTGAGKGNSPAPTREIRHLGRHQVWRPPQPHVEQEQGYARVTFLLPHVGVTSDWPQKLYGWELWRGTLASTVQACHPSRCWLSAYWQSVHQVLSTFGLYYAWVKKVIKESGALVSPSPQNKNQLLCPTYIPMWVMIFWWPKFPSTPCWLPSPQLRILFFLHFLFYIVALLQPLNTFGPPEAHRPPQIRIHSIHTTNFAATGQAKDLSVRSYSYRSLQGLPHFLYLYDTCAWGPHGGPRVFP